MFVVVVLFVVVVVFVVFVVLLAIGEHESPSVDTLNPVGHGLTH